MKRKYTRIGEDPVKYECTKRKCKWQGTDCEKKWVDKGDSMQEAVCPECGHNEFYGLL